jgi:hypothetical protein
MKKSHSLCRRSAFAALFLALATVVFAYPKMPIIRAKSKSVDIRVGNELRRNAWTIVPEAKPDIYHTSKKGEKITFYTDVDSISCIVKTDAPFDFIILLDGKDTAWTQVAYRPSHLERLRAAAVYDVNDPTEIPKFTYQSPDDPNLQALRKGLNLDSIAGGGSDVSKVLRLLHWLHDLVPHDGQHGNPSVMNAMNMLTVCKNEKRGLNCRGLSIVLNECYLSLGLKSRYATCMPKDTVFDDCHVINMVWIKDLNKWIWVDATNDAYVMDENGTLLSIEEVRERVINGKPLIINPDANWNHKSQTTKEAYLYEYMAKNLYRIECPLSSEYDFETFEKGEKVPYVELLPLDAYQQTPKKTETVGKKSGAVFTNYKTNNPRVFWTKPE